MGDAVQHVTLSHTLHTHHTFSHPTHTFSWRNGGAAAGPRPLPSSTDANAADDDVVLPLLCDDAAWAAERDGRGDGRGAQENMHGAGNSAPMVPVLRASVRETARLAMCFAPMWLIANWSYNASLCRSCGTGTSVSNSTLLSASSSVFTFLFSVLFLGDAFSLARLACAVMNLGGVALLVLYDGSVADTSNTIGDLMGRNSQQSALAVILHNTFGRELTFEKSCVAVAVFSAACMAGYSVQLKHMLPDHSDTSAAQVSMPMLFGFLGVSAAVLCVPLFLAAVTMQWQGVLRARISLYKYM